MSAYKIRGHVLFLAATLLVGCASAPVSTEDRSPRPDGRYDNHAYLVDSSQMNLSRVVSSIVILVTRTKFRLPDGEEIEKELVGSGVVVGDRFILTVEHTVAQGTIKISTPVGVMKLQVKKLAEKTFLRHDGVEHPLRALVLSPEDDVALFEIPRGVNPPSFPYSLGNSDDLQVGNYIYAIGNPLNMGVNVREGIVSALRAPREVARVAAKNENAFMVSNGLSPGDSGTPVIAIRDGRFEMVGLSQGTFVGGGRLGWVIRINAIRLLINKARSMQKKEWAKTPTPVPLKIKNGWRPLSSLWGLVSMLP
ncbi:MAG: trypsin-like peptidase domain-containing protein [Nitrospinaceae bacterium]|jgi:S1-C subfamily serine protease|nr:trypsin-like peptidase domain-containing protein [Nitrospinaceae bacterium]MBT4432010.1 trypsin-like peptidase domain-containing protein [Nitrospinaceae bacterium]MBT5946980.1 trypsin-like peptidase domain-containing protein [Nitrospinaceae bacterium]MBT6396557.1 trypsin-like peptidase domain-containing protein [Nitrospinaceae bacterium]MBT7858440.1 trypsin-like peptidase domain-containing protein [Nitrospinaceae bacterium]